MQSNEDKLVGIYTGVGIFESATKLTETELRAMLEILDRRELESLIQAIYAAAGGLN